MSRLKLNFDLNSTEERAQFIEEYTSKWTYSPFTEDELEMMGNYILWGKNPETGKNVVQEKSIQISTRNNHWQSGHEEESLDALLETPTFNEGVIVQPKQAPYRIPREVFSREMALAQAPQYLKEVLEDLFVRIDTLDLIISYYDLNSGKRKEQPREELTEKFNEEEKEKFKQIAADWTQRKYLQNRHLLVELRREQYTIRDTYLPTITRHTPRVNEPVLDIFNVEDLEVYPMGMYDKLLFPDPNELDPEGYHFSELQRISDFINKPSCGRPQLYFDFTDPQSVHELINYYVDSREEINRALASHQIGQEKNLADTLKYYMSNAELTDIQREVLFMKINKKKNEDIAGYINGKYEKSYTPNYISTIYRQRIIPAICEAAIMHRDTMENIFFPENFKQCTGCGMVLLKDNRNFVRKSRSKDMFASKCKRCDKKDREEKKLKYKSSTQIAAD